MEQLTDEFRENPHSRHPQESHRYADALCSLSCFARRAARPGYCWRFDRDIDRFLEALPATGPQLDSLFLDIGYRPPVAVRGSRYSTASSNSHWAGSACYYDGMADFVPGDCDPDITFNAVGRAISAWETLEAHLSYLYSAFVRQPMLLDAIEQYGRETRTFQNRIAHLGRAAAVYFKDQAQEAEFHALIAEVEQLHRYRTQIAHGALRAVPVAIPVFNHKGEIGGAVVDGSKYSFTIAPPWYGNPQLSALTGSYYHYGSQTILGFIAEFDELTRRIIALYRKLLSFS